MSVFFFFMRDWRKVSSIPIPQEPQFKRKVSLQYGFDVRSILCPERRTSLLLSAVGSVGVQRTNHTQPEAHSHTHFLRVRGSLERTYRVVLIIEGLDSCHGVPFEGFGFCGV